MSRGFVKEEDQELTPMVAPRAELPEGVPNYVTPAGMAELLAEKQTMLDEKEHLDKRNENEYRIALNHLNTRLRQLEERIAGAKVVEPGEQPQDEIRFGAIVTFRREGSSGSKTFQIVGVDEADIPKGKISFLSPLARALNNRKSGEKAVMLRGAENVVFEVLEVRYQL